ncbi:response regulator transcription factor [bacterium]|nr:MAG: response regulator transcription factor [bacterium]
MGSAISTPHGNGAAAANIKTVAGEKILVVDDEPGIVDFLKAYLVREGFEVATALTAAEALALARADEPDLMILDLTLPDGNGYDVYRTVSARRRVPTIMLTARGEEIDRIAGLEMGADDYVTKPFSPREVTARARAILRRSLRNSAFDGVAETTRVRGLAIDRVAHEVRVNGRVVGVTPTEFRILTALAEHAGQVLTRVQLLDYLQDDGSIFERTLDRHIGNLRRKIEPDPVHPSYVVTVFGVGYKMRKV